MKPKDKQPGWIRIGQFFRDIHIAVRILWKNPGYTLLSMLILGLGIGAVSIFFGVLNVLVIDPFSYPISDRIVYIWSNYSSSFQQPLSLPDYDDIREQSKLFADIGVFSPERVNLSLDRPEPVHDVRCTAGVLRTFGIQPFMGRLLEEADEKKGAAPVAVISHSLWKRVFNGDPQALGRMMRIDGRDTTVVGIMPSDFEFQSAWFGGNDIELWVPLERNDTIMGTFRALRGAHWLVGIGRLNDGVSIEAADAEIKTIGARLAAEYPESNQHKPFVLRSLWQQTTESTASPGILLLGAVALLLLVACINVASMLLARGFQRQGEFAVRLAMGGSRQDIIRLLLCESLLLSFLGCVIGIIMAKWGLVWMQKVIPSTLIIAERRELLQLNGMLVLFSVGLSVITGLLSGLPPAFFAIRTPVVENLKSDGRSQTGSRLRHRFLQYLVAGQIGITMVLGSGALLFSSSYFNVLQDNRDLDTNKVVTAEIALRGERYQNLDAAKSFFNDFFERVHVLPGVSNVAITTRLPLSGGGMTSEFLVDDEPYDPTIQRPLAEMSFISPEYFAAMGISLIRGRFLEAEDSGSEVQMIIVNQALADQCWPGQDPIGKSIRSNTPAMPFFQGTVVGVIADIRQEEAENSVIPEIFLPSAFNGVTNSFTLVVRTTGDAHQLIPSLRNVVTTIDADLPLANVRTMKEVVSKSTNSRRLLTQLVGLFMTVTLILAMVGVYGTLSYTVSQRMREIGIRMSLGAMRRDILKFIFRQAAAWSVAGLIAGLLLTIALSFPLRSAFYNVNPLDPRLLVMVIVIIAAAVGAACFLPARRASRVDPMEALRFE